MIEEKYEDRKKLCRENVERQAQHVSVHFPNRVFPILC